MCSIITSMLGHFASNFHDTSLVSIQQFTMAKYNKLLDYIPVYSL